MLPWYQADFRCPKELEPRWKTTTDSFLSLVSGKCVREPYNYERYLPDVPGKELKSLGEALIDMPEVKRRLITRLGIGLSRCESSAFPVIAGFSYGLGLGNTANECAEKCVERYGALLKDDAADDLVGFVLKLCLEKDQDPKPLVEAIFNNPDRMIRTLKLLGYVSYGRLSIWQDIHVKLRNMADWQVEDLGEIDEWCLERGKCWISRLLGIDDVVADEGWLNLAAYCKEVLRCESISVLAKMIVKQPGSAVRVEPRSNQYNQKWEKCSKNDKSVLDKWLEPLEWCDHDPNGREVRFSLIDDVTEQFQIGNWFGSCLGLVNGLHNYELIGLVTDINKGILVCRSNDGHVIGRRTLGISNAGLHICDAQPFGHPTVRRLLNKGTMTLLNSLHLPKADDYTEKSLCQEGIMYRAAPAYCLDWNIDTWEREFKEG